MRLHKYTHLILNAKNCTLILHFASASGDLEKIPDSQHVKSWVSLCQPCHFLFGVRTGLSHAVVYPRREVRGGGFNPSSSASSILRWDVMEKSFSVHPFYYCMIFVCSIMLLLYIKVHVTWQTHVTQSCETAGFFTQETWLISIAKAHIDTSTNILLYTRETRSQSQRNHLTAHQPFYEVEITIIATYTRASVPQICTQIGRATTTIADASKNGAITLYRMNFSGYAGHTTSFSWTLTTACCLVHVVWAKVRFTVGIIFSVWLVRNMVMHTYLDYFPLSLSLSRQKQSTVSDLWSLTTVARTLRFNTKWRAEGELGKPY